MNILVIDVGTSSMRAVLFSPAGERLATARRQYSPVSGEGGIKVEQEPGEFRAALCECCRELAETGLAVSAVAMTAQRSSVIAVDEDGEALYPAIMWHDKRSADICAEKNAAFGDTLAKLGGMRALPVHSAPKMLYIKRFLPEINEKAYKLAGIQDYLLYGLTGRFVTDDSLASRSMLMDVQTGEWSAELAEAFGVAPEKLCELLPCGAVCGRLTTKAAVRLGLNAGIPVVTAGGDQQSAVLGLGAVKPGSVVINIGTGSYSAAVLDSFVPSGKSGVSVLRSAESGKWLLEASAPSAGDAVSWLCSVLYDSRTAYDRLFADAERAAPGCGGVSCSCSINGAGTPDWDTLVRGSFSGLSAAAGKPELCRALLEAIARDAAENTARVSEMSGAQGRFLAAGGITQNALFRRILRDALGRPVDFALDAEATSRGAWITAAVSLGLYPDARTAWESSK